MLKDAATCVVQGKPARNSKQQTIRVDIFFQRRMISYSSTRAVTIHSTPTNYNTHTHLTYHSRVITGRLVNIAVYSDIYNQCISTPRYKTLYTQCIINHIMQHNTLTTTSVWQLHCRHLAVQSVTTNDSFNLKIISILISIGQNNCCSYSILFLQTIFLFCGCPCMCPWWYTKVCWFESLQTASPGTSPMLQHQHSWAPRSTDKILRSKVEIPARPHMVK